MEFRLLGPVDLRAESGRLIEVGPAKTQLLLAALLMDADRVVSFNTLVYRVWDEAAPMKVALSVQSNFSRLRRKLAEAGAADGILEFVQPNGYRLRASTEQVDFLKFDRTVAAAHAAMRRGTHEQALELLRQAERIARGEPLAGLSGPWVDTARTMLQERQHAARLTRISLQLEQEDPRPLIGELRELSGHHRLDEAVVALLMRVLYLVGRSADALAEYERLRLRLQDQLGIDPHRPLKELRQQILRGEVTARPDRRSPGRAEAVSSLDTLEPEPVGFIGRREEIESIERDVERQLATGQSALVLIDGMPGVGKSMLALLLAHRLRARAADIALQLPLRGHDPAQLPTEVDAALRLLLMMLGTDPQQVQRIAGLDHAITLWRRRTAGRRVVLLLDDAASGDQIRQLLPTGSGSVVLVTARQRLTAFPGAVRHTLLPMRPADATELFVHTSNTAIGDEHADALTAIVSACGQLPMALAVTGGYLSTRSSWSLRDLADRLARMLVPQESDALAARLTAAFETSYRDLSDLPKRMLRRLGLYPAEHISLGAAAALAGMDRPTAELALDTLVDHNLLAEPERHHYRLHNAVRLFAAAALHRDESVDELSVAEDRLVTFTLGATDAATAVFQPHRHMGVVAAEMTGRPAPLERYTDTVEAGRWLDNEQESLRVLAMHWYAHGRRAPAASLTHLLARYLDRRSLWKESAPLLNAALVTWRAEHNARGEAYALTDLARLSWRLRAFEQAKSHAENALTAWRQLHDGVGEADALLQLGRAHQYVHRAGLAVCAYQEAAALCERASDAHGEAVARYHLGTALVDQGGYVQGVAETEMALQLARQTRDAAVERNCLNNLGEMLHYYRGAHQKAAVYYRQAFAIAEQLGDVYNIAIAALNLGQVEIELEHYEPARPLLDQALAGFRHLGWRQNELSALLALVQLDDVTGLVTAADALIQEADAVAAELGSTAALAALNFVVGGRHRRHGCIQEATDAYRQALQYARAAQMPPEQAAAHRALGGCLMKLDQPDEAKEHWGEALVLYESLGSVYADELRGLLNNPGIVGA